jgi:hypothetical protein
MARTALDIIEIGKELIEVKKNIGHGHFLPWIEAEFGMSERSARRFMESSEAFSSKTANLADLPPSVIYALAAPSTPEEVREVIVERAASGEKVTAAEVKQLKDKLKEKEEKIKQIKNQKEIADGYIHRLENELRGEANKALCLNDRIANLQEEMRRLSEPGVITIAPVKINEDGEVLGNDGERLIPDNPPPDIEPWRCLFRSLWGSAPLDAKEWIKNYVSGQTP